MIRYNDRRKSGIRLFPPRRSEERLIQTSSTKQKEKPMCPGHHWNVNKTCYICSLKASRTRWKIFCGVLVIIWLGWILSIL